MAYDVLTKCRRQHGHGAPCGHRSVAPSGHYLSQSRPEKYIAITIWQVHGAYNIHLSTCLSQQDTLSLPFAKAAGGKAQS